MQFVLNILQKDTEKHLIAEIARTSKEGGTNPKGLEAVLRAFNIRYEIAHPGSIELLEKKIRDGWRPDVAPQGYLNDRVTESGFRRIFTDPERMTFIRKIFELHYQGRSVTEIPMATTVDKIASVPLLREGE